MPITFPLTKLTVVVEIALGVDPSSDPAGWSWTDITAFVRYAPGIQITKGRRDEASRVDAATARLTLDNRDGRFCRRNPLGPYYGQLSKNTPIRIGVNPGTGTAYRMHGFVNEWPTRWDKTGRESNVPITCAGILRRLARSPALRSPMYRGIPLDNPLGWWPLETDLKSGLPGGADMAQSGQVNFGANTGHPGSAPLPDYTGGGRLKARLPNGSVSNSFRAEFTARFGTGSNSIADFTTVVDISMPLGDVNVWEFFVTDALSIVGAKGAAFQWTNSSGSFTGAMQTDALVDDGDWHHFRVDVAQSGGNISVTFTVDGTIYGGTTLVGKNLDTTRSRVTINPLQEKAAYVGAVGHFTWWAPHVASSIDTAVLATGYTGESASARMTRLCSEEDVSFTLTGTASAAMGPQPVGGTLLDLLRECESADQGILYENQFGLGYLAASQRYNAASALDLDFNAGDIAEPPEPADDDQQTLNRFTASRSNGSSSITVESASSIADDGLYASSGTFNVQPGRRVSDIASWKVHLGTVDEDRWPAIPIRLARTPNRITAWVALTIGARITIANPPDQVAPDTINAIVEGWTETIIPHMWEAVLNTSPAQPYEAFKVADQTRGRVDTDGSALFSAASSGATSLTVVTAPSQNPVWINSTSRPGDFPFDVNGAGEQIRVTAATAPQVTFRGSGTAAHANNAALTPALPAGLAQGDLLLVYAACRSLTGSPDLISGYTPLFSGNNFELYGKIAGASELAPTVTFSGTVSGDTTSAQTAAFSGVDTTVLAAAWQLNASSPNILTPALTVRRDYSLIIWLGWKQTSDTSTSFGFSLIGDMTSALGSTQSMAWYYQIQTAASSRAGNLISVTGGVSAVNAAATIALPQNRQTLTVTRSVNGIVKALPAGTAISRWKPQVIAL